MQTAKSPSETKFCF